MVGGWEVAISHIGANDPREDRSGIHQAGSGSLFAVIDGHGGFECADFVSKMLLPSAAGFINEGSPPDEALGSAVQAVEESWLAKVRNEEAMPNSGACVVMLHVEGCEEGATVQGQGRLTVGNSGDCRCVLGTMGDANGDIKAVALSRDHNARMPEEQRRLIQEHPGESDVVMRADRWSQHWYIKGRLQPSRTIGDYHMKLPEFNVVPGGTEPLFRDPYTPPYIRPDPQVISRDITLEDQFVILATDGLWDGIGNEDAVRIVQAAILHDKNPAAELIDETLEVAALSAGCPRKLLDKLPEGSLRRRIHDDITVIVINLKK